MQEDILSVRLGASSLRGRDHAPSTADIFDDNWLPQGVLHSFLYGPGAVAVKSTPPGGNPTIMVTG